MTGNNSSENWNKKLPQIDDGEHTRNAYDANFSYRTSDEDYDANRSNMQHHKNGQFAPRRAPHSANGQNRTVVRHPSSKQHNAQNMRNPQTARNYNNTRSQGYNSHEQHRHGTQAHIPHVQNDSHEHSPRQGEYKNQGQQSQLREKFSKFNLDPRILGILCVVCVVVVGVLFIGAIGQAALNNQDSSSDSQVIDPDQVVSQEQTETTQETNVNAVDPNNVPGSSKSSDEKIVYLTFDDGPSELTPQVLDILDKYNAKATFFVVGHSEEHFYLIAEEAKRGHTIGMHTYTHDYAQVYASDEAYFDDLDKISQVVKEQIGYVPAYIRFPGGSSNTVSAKYCEGIMSRLVDSVHEKGFQYYDWNVSSGDGSNITTDAEIDASIGHDDFNNIVLLCHDSATKQSTVDALPSIIEYYQERGYAFKGIDRSTFDAHHTPQN